MRHRNEEDDFVVKSTGQRVVFVAIIFVYAPPHPQSLSATFLFVPFVRRHSKPYYGIKP
jgi:hypothetical protein